VSDAQRIAKATKAIAFWSNRTNDAYAVGEADWAFGPNGNHLTAIATYALKHHGDNVKGWDSAAYAVENEAKARGHRPEAPPLAPAALSQWTLSLTFVGGGVYLHASLAHLGGWGTPRGTFASPHLTLPTLTTLYR
jgi:hypothetical protein